MKITIVLVLLYWCSAIDAAALNGNGCPDGHKPNETWNLPGCQQCSCGDTKYECYSCGPMALEIDTQSCYLETNDTASYPDCCMQMIFCVGDLGFNASKLQAPSPIVSDNTPAPKPIRKPIEKHAHKNTTKPTPKPAPKPGPKLRQNPDPKPAPKPAPKARQNPDPKPAPKPAPKARQNPTPKPTPTPKPKANPAPRSEKHRN